MPLHFSNKKGELYITFEVLFPTTLTEDRKTRIKEVLGNDTLILAAMALCSQYHSIGQQISFPLISAGSFIER
ncbi:hypothetical protein CUMW_083600, partial [Citrus unshiu]